MFENLKVIVSDNLQEVCKKLEILGYSKVDFDENNITYALTTHKGHYFLANGLNDKSKYFKSVEIDYLE